jgi:hypothetical protein
MYRLNCSVVVVAAESAAAASTTVIAAIAAAIAATVTTTIPASASAVAATIATAIATTTTVATTSAATAEAGAITLGARTSLVHHQVTTVEILAVGAFDGSTAGIVIGHFDEPEAAAPIRHLVHDDLGRSDLSEWSEKLVEILVLH